jgi:4-hydroxy-tetrahydrodipicolinate synthase
LRWYHASTGAVLKSLNDGAAGLSPIAANCYPEVFSWLCANHRARPALAGRVQRVLRVLEPAVCVQYGVSAKRFLALRGVPIGPYARGSVLRVDHELETTQMAMLETVEALRAELGIVGE